MLHTRSSICSFNSQNWYHHLAGLLGLGCLGYAGQQIHVSLPINACMDAIDAGKPLTIGGRVIDSVAAIPLPHEWILDKGFHLE